MVYMISLLNIVRFINIIAPIRTTSVIKFQKLFWLSNLLYDATLCSKLFQSADGMIRKTSIKVSHRPRIPVYINHSEVGKKFDRNISTIRV